MFDRVQILPNRLKQVKPCLNRTKQCGQTKKCFATQQCFNIFYRKTFTVSIDIYAITIILFGSSILLTSLCRANQNVQLSYVL